MVSSSKRTCWILNRSLKCSAKLKPNSVSSISLSATRDQRQPRSSIRRWRSLSNSGMPRPIPRQKRFSSLCTRRFHSWIKAAESWLSLMPREPYGRTATLGRHGFSQGRARISRTLLRGRSRQTRHHSECHQSGMDRGQRVELTARTGSGTHPQLAHTRMDANGAAGNARRCRQCCAATFFGGSQLDHWASDIRRWRRVVDES